MQLERNQTAILSGTRLVLCSLLSFVAMAAVASGKRIRLTPKFGTGDSLRYRIESTTTTSGKTTTPIVNPEGATQSILIIHMLVRLEVLSAPATGPGAIHLRATYEKSEADSQSDAFDPGGPSIAEQYARLQGQSIDFALDPNGKIADVKELEQATTNRSAAGSMLTLLSGLIPTSDFPASGVEIGEKWKSEKPIQGAPFSDLVSRSESTYLRDEPCPGALTTLSPGRSGEPDVCAAILTTFAIARRGSAHSDATPDEYARNGLRVAGTWSGSGQTLDWISLATGRLIRSTQTMDQQTDYDIASASSGSKIHEQSHVQSQSETVLEPAATHE